MKENILLADVIDSEEIKELVDQVCKSVSSQDRTFRGGKFPLDFAETVKIDLWKNIDAENMNGYKVRNHSNFNNDSKVIYGTQDYNLYDAFGNMSVLEFFTRAFEGWKVHSRPQHKAKMLGLLGIVKESLVTKAEQKVIRAMLQADCTKEQIKHVYKGRSDIDSYL